jgi:hypothetical protein
LKFVKKLLRFRVYLLADIDKKIKILYLYLMRKIKITLSILIFITISLSLQPSTILHRNEAKDVSFTYVPEYRVDTIDYNGKSYISIVLMDGKNLADEGMPEIPLKHYSLAIGIYCQRRIYKARKGF